MELNGNMLKPLHEGHDSEIRADQSTTNLHIIFLNTYRMKLWLNRVGWSQKSL